MKWEDALPALLERQQAQTGPPAAAVLRQVLTRRALSWAVGLGLAVVAAYAVGTVAASQVAANPRTSAFGLALVLTGLPVYALWVRRPSLPPTPLSPS